MQISNHLCFSIYFNIQYQTIKLFAISPVKVFSTLPIIQVKQCNQFFFQKRLHGMQEIFLKDLF